MREFLYVIKDPMGFHARPASQVFMEARKYISSVKVSSEGEQADGKNLLSLMGLGVKEGGVVRFRLEGPDEEEAEAALKAVLEEI